MKLWENDSGKLISNCSELLSCEVCPCFQGAVVARCSIDHKGNPNCDCDSLEAYGWLMVLPLHHCPDGVRIFHGGEWQEPDKVLTDGWGNRFRLRVVEEYDTTGKAQDALTPPGWAGKTQEAVEAEKREWGERAIETCSCCCFKHTLLEVTITDDRRYEWGNTVLQEHAFLSMSGTVTFQTRSDSNIQEFYGGAVEAHEGGSGGNESCFDTIDPDRCFGAWYFRFNGLSGDCRYWNFYGYLDTTLCTGRDGHCTCNASPPVESEGCIIEESFPLKNGIYPEGTYTYHNSRDWSSGSSYNRGYYHYTVTIRPILDAAFAAPAAVAEVYGELSDELRR